MEELVRLQTELHAKPIKPYVMAAVKRMEVIRIIRIKSNPPVSAHMEAMGNARMERMSSIRTADASLPIMICAGVSGVMNNA